MYNGGFSHRSVADHFRVNHSIIVRLMQRLRQISSLLEKILLKQIRWCLTFVGLYHGCIIKDHWEMDLHEN
jgi:hypothetical protein